MPKKIENPSTLNSNTITPYPPKTIIPPPTHYS